MHGADQPASSVNVGGSVRGENVVIGGSQTVHGDLTITVGALPTASEDAAAALEQQLRELTERLTAVPAEHAHQVQEVKLAAEDALGELERDAPDASRVSVRLAALRHAAKRLGAIAPPVLAIVEQLAKTISAIV